jgi:hypothetical protein
MNQLGELGYEIWDVEFGNHKSDIERDAKALLISGYLEANLGELNILINTDFQYKIDGDVVSPALKKEEEAIFTQLYIRDNLSKEARLVLQGAQEVSLEESGDVAWTELREGDSSIKRSIPTSTSKNNSAKLFQSLAKEASEALEKMVHSYNMYGSIPSQIAGNDSPV